MSDAMGLSYEARLISRYAGVASRLGKSEAPKPRRVALMAPAAPVVVEPVAEPAPAPEPLPRPDEDQLDPPVLLKVASWKKILIEVSNKHRIAVSQIIGRSRSADVVAARDEAIWRMWNDAGMSYTDIGRRLDKRDHTTIIYAMAKMRHDPNLTFEVGVYLPRSKRIKATWTTQKEAKAIELRKLGMTYQEISNAIGISRTAIARKLIAFMGDESRNARDRAVQMEARR